MLGLRRGGGTKPSSYAGRAEDGVKWLKSVFTLRVERGYDGTIYYVRWKPCKWVMAHLFLSGDHWWLHTHSCDFLALPFFGVAREVIVKDGRVRNRLVWPFVPRLYRQDVRHTLDEAALYASVNICWNHTGRFWVYPRGPDALRPAYRYRYRRTD